MGLQSGPARRGVLKAALAVGLGAGVAGCSRFTDLYEPGEARRVLDELRGRAGEGETVRYLFDRSSMQLAVIKPTVQALSSGSAGTAAGSANDPTP